MGKLNGLIAPTTPIGTRIVNATLPAPAGEASIGIVSPVRRRQTAAAVSYVDTARDASTRAAFIGLPASAEIVCAASSWRSARSSATRSRIPARSCAESGSRIAASAASTALRVSAASAAATRPTSSPEKGEFTWRHSPVSTHSPATRSFRSPTVAAMRPFKHAAAMRR